MNNISAEDYLLTLNSTLRLWQWELKCNEYRMRSVAERAIKILKDEIARVKEAFDVGEVITPFWGFVPF